MSSESVFSQTPIKTLTFNTQNAETYEFLKNGKIATILSDSEADIIALQECTASGVAKAIKNRMTNASNFTVIEYDDVGPALIYNNTKFTCDDYGCWTLGLKNDGSGTNYDRHAVYAKLKRVEDGAIILAVATHYDYNSTAANAQTTKLLELISENFGGIRSIIMGDFNVTKNNGVFTKHENAGYIDANTGNNDEYTYDQKIIDFIYVKGFKTSVYDVLDNNGTSDHRPVFAEIVIK